MKQKTLLFLSITAFMLISFRASIKTTTSIGVENTLDYFAANADTFALSTQQLANAIQRINKDSSTILTARESLKQCRLAFKRIEFFTAYFFPSETRMYNAAPVFEVEEPTLELVEPMGLQQIEVLLFEDDVSANKPLLLAHTDALLTSVNDLHSLLYQFSATDAQVLESVRIQLIRMMTLSISGYDAPSLKSGITETLEATTSMLTILQPYLLQEPVSGKRIAHRLSNSIAFLATAHDFDAFDRMKYLKEFALPLQQELGQLIKGLDLELNTTAFLNYQAPNLYSKGAIRDLGYATATLPPNPALTALGKELFSDPSLSGNSATSCATCHHPRNYFNDGLQKSPSLHPDSVLKRNTPSLLYSGNQHMQFWEGRAGSLEEQIIDVLLNPIEMDGKREFLSSGKVFQREKYRQLTESAFPEKTQNALGLSEIASAIASYVAALQPMNSPFDRYINGDESALTDLQIAGFNLFMGKAQCGTCHFPPYFNSLLPPLFDVSEVEILGTPNNDDLDHPVKDEDRGRYDLYKMKYYKGAFKTPTVRNAAKTSPYMHNGAFKTLEGVIELYNRGGGSGIGLLVPDQTLSTKPLNLTPDETNSIVTFIDALTDSI
jgi:cytochrome c peroxidase